MFKYPANIKSDFDKKIFRYLSEMLSDEPIDQNGRIQTPRITDVLDYVYQVDISMKRQKRAIVEKSISRCNFPFQQFISIFQPGLFLPPFPLPISHLKLSNHSLYFYLALPLVISLIQNQFDPNDNEPISFDSNRTMDLDDG
ncbi:hypothetical protein AYI70_g11775 [Smittium culicis]|uniref:Uncharacterized protein n=1 Tax=Smittium culicis TaxID=133412 RepID=A0A1R1X0D7_9FUNG|nr:hypothetical protein AYI70_g11775 [Smittium culicis]